MYKAMGLSILIAIAASTVLAAADEAKDDQVVRKLAVKIGLPELGKLSTTRGVTIFHSSEEAGKSLGEGIAKQIAGQMDFAKEDLVLIAWVKAGPPKAKDEKRELLANHETLAVFDGVEYQLCLKAYRTLPRSVRQFRRVR